MILADTSIWIRHFRHATPQLEQALIDGLIVMHPFVLGEIACGNLRDRSNVITALRQLPCAMIAEHEEIMAFVEHHRLFGSGIGWVDAHLLASTRLTGCRLWTLDARLRQAASSLNLLHLG